MQVAQDCGEGRSRHPAAVPRGPSESRPEPNASSSFGGKIALGLADGTVVSIPMERLSVLLDEQNDLRAEHGLAPLPDPKTVTHGKPAVGGP